MPEKGYANELPAPAERLVVGKIRSLSEVRYHLRLTIASAKAWAAAISDGRTDWTVTAVY